MASGNMTMNLTADPDAVEFLEIAARVGRIDHKLNLLLTALENVRVLSAVRDESGDVIGLNAVVAPPMVETGIR